MKDIKNLLIYGGLAGAAIFLLATLGSSEAVSGGVKLMLAVFLVVVVPLVWSVFIARKERREKGGQ